MRISSNHDHMPYLSSTTAHGVRRSQNGLSAAPSPESTPGERDQVRLSPVARQLQRAEQLLARELAPRPEVVQRGRELLANWRDLDDGAVDELMARFLNEEG